MSSNIVLYHQVPPNLRGETLVPGNSLPSDLKEAALAKYAGREGLLQKKVPPLGCLWNDTLQMLAVHPGEVKRLVGSFGFQRYAKEPETWFVVPLEALDQSALAAYFYDPAIEDVPIPATKEEARRTIVPHQRFELFDSSRINVYRTIPGIMSRYLEAERKKGPAGQLFPFNFVPHVLYRGRIPLKGLETETVELA